MAEEIQIRGGDAVGKLRNPLGVVGLTLVTLGIYGFVWYYKVNKEMAELGRAKRTEDLGTSPGTSLAAVLVGWLIIVPPFVSIYKTCGRLNAGERLTSLKGMEGGLLFLLWIFVSPVAYYIFQSNLNKVLQAQAGITPDAPQWGPTSQPAPRPGEPPAAPPPPPAG